MELTAKRSQRANEVTPRRTREAETPRASGGWLDAAAFVAALSAYVFTLAPGIPAGDSGELIAAAATAGVAHPPGYPLFTMLGRAWIAVVPFGEIAWRLNLLSAVCAAAAVAVLGRTVRGWTGSRVAGLVAASLLAFAPPFWKNAVVAEVFALNALLAAALLEAFRGVAQSPEVSRGFHRSAAAVAFLTGLALAHQHSLLLLAVPVLLATLVLRALAPRPAFRAATELVLPLLAGLLPIAWIPLAARLGSPVSWGDVRSLEDLADLLLRADYGTFQLDAAGAGFAGGPNRTLAFLGSLPHDLGWPGLALAACGVAALVRRRALALVLLGFAVLQAAFFSRIHFPAEPIYSGVVERFHVLPELVLALVGGLGAAAVLAKLRGAARAGAAAALLALVTILPVALHGRAVSHRDDRFAEDWGRDLLASVPEGGVLFVRGDLAHNQAVALQETRRYRRDVTVVNQELMTYPWYVRQLRRRAPDLLPRLGYEDRYSGKEGTRNVVWLDHLTPRRAVAFFGFKEDSWRRRYEMTPWGYVELASARGAAPSPERQAGAAREFLAAFHLDPVLREFDPASFEAAERPRVANFADRAVVLFAQTSAWPDSADPVAKRLHTLIARAERAPRPEPALLRAAGMARIFDPTFRDAALAERDLQRWLASGASGPEAEQARRWLALLATRDSAAVGSR